MLNKPSIDDAYQADIAYQEQQEAKWETMADDAQRLGEFRKVALERMYQDYGLDEELVEHCMGEMFRRLTWHSEHDANHPYDKPGGEQKHNDDYDTILEHVKGWLIEQEKQVREEYIQKLREQGAT